MAGSSAARQGNPWLTCSAGRSPANLVAMKARRGPKFHADLGNLVGPGLVVALIATWLIGKVDHANRGPVG
jgi:hypothetical protein